MSMNEAPDFSTCNFKSPWYLSTPLICILFAAWFVYGIPVLLGILLLIAKAKHEKKITIQVQNQIQDLSKRYADAQALLTPEMKDAHKLQLLVASLHDEESSANKNLANFDVHAMIFSDDAPALEAALHRAFEDRKLNMVNQRREFFNVTLDEIKEVIKKNFDKTVEFVDVPDAEQYRISQKMRSEMKHSA